MIDLSWIPGPGVVPWCCLVDPKQHGAAETWVSRHRTEKGVACRHTEAGWWLWDETGGQRDCSLMTKKGRKKRHFVEGTHF